MCEAGCLPSQPARPGPTYGSTSAHPTADRPRDPREGELQGGSGSPPTRSPTRRTTPRSPTNDKDTPDRYLAERAPLRGARQKALAGGARRAAPRSSQGTVSFYWNVPVLAEHARSTRTEKCCGNLRVRLERRSAAGTCAFAWNAEVLREPGRSPGTSTCSQNGGRTIFRRSRAVCGTALQRRFRAKRSALCSSTWLGKHRHRKSSGQCSTLVIR